MPLLPVILSGGSGTRLWPLSRQLMPKQFLPLAGKQTMFQTTLQRLHGIPGLELPVVVCNEEHRFIVAEQLREIGMGHQGILLEPAARNTAPAIVLRPSISLDTLLRDPNPKRRVRDEAQEGRVGEGARPLVGEVQA